MRLYQSVFWAGILFWVAGSLTGIRCIFVDWSLVGGNINYASAMGLPIAFISLGTSLIAVSISLKSDLLLKALTNLNFFEKMAILEAYKAEHASASNKLIDANKRNLERCNYDICAISALDPFLIDKEKKKDRSCSACEVAAYARQHFQEAEYEDYLRKIEESAKKLGDKEQ